MESANLVPAESVQLAHPISPVGAVCGFSFLVKMRTKRKCNRQTDDCTLKYCVIYF
jgi:hypothetical protein